MNNFFPKISIVTASYNQGHFIEQTIQSVLSQNYPNLEYVIIDGGSTDNSVEIIKKYEQHLKYWVSEKDLGQANAINKGLQHCTGEVFNWLNSDDYLELNCLFKISEAFLDERVQMVAGKVRIFSATQHNIIQNQKLSARGLMCWEHGVQFVQPGVWMRRQLIDKCGGIDEQYHYAFDWDLYIRYLYQFAEVKEIDELLVHFRLHDQSKTQSLGEQFHVEERKIIENIYTLEGFTELKDVCLYKIQKTNWTAFLSNISNSKMTLLNKYLTVLKSMPNYNKVSYSRQTAGALKAFISNKVI
jgi:glycosyltransferase involved in cell wall biosynthesis